MKVLFKRIGFVLLASISISSLDSFMPGSWIVVLLFLIVLAGAVAWSLYLVYLIVRELLRKQLHSASLEFIALVICIPLLLFGFKAGDYVHLLVLYPYYKAVIASEADHSKPIRFAWGDYALWVTDGLQFKTLIYDAGPSTELLVGQVRDESYYLKIYTRRLIGNFYLEYEYSG